MNWLKTCTDFYKAGYYDNDSLKIFVVKGKITEQNYFDITGIQYVAHL